MSILERILRFLGVQGERLADCDGDDWAPFPCIQSAESGQLDPGEGWRPLQEGEQILRGDEYQTHTGDWAECKSPGRVLTRDHYPVRRRIITTSELLNRATGKRPDIEQQVCKDILDRQKLGVAKYGTTVAENPLELLAWLQHNYEELLDAAVYANRAMAELDDKMQPYIAVVEAATQVVRKASIGDQNFIRCLYSDDGQTKELRQAIVSLTDALKEV